MATAIIQPSFATGEVSPSLFGRVDLAKWHVGLATCRNFFVNYRGGASSRAGTAFVGVSKQNNLVYPPRLIRFQFSLNQGIIIEFGHLYARFISNGGYITEAVKNITGITNANPGVVTSAAHGFSNGDQIFLSSIVGMTRLNGNIYTAANVTANTFTLIDIFGNVVDTTLFGVYTSGGTAARIYTIVSPYIQNDLAALKFTQSADVMSLTHPNYPPYDLTRISSNNWTLVSTSFGSAIAAPTGCTASTTTTSATPTIYQYVVTAIDANTGQESIASNIATITNSANIAITAGSHTISWTGSAGAGEYRVYQAPATFQTTPPAGTIFGYIGTALGTSFVNNNITPDFATSPPIHFNPFPSANNYPSCVAYFQERRVYANTLNNPDTYFMSQPGAFTNFDSSAIPLADDAIIGTPWAQQVNGIQALVPVPSGLITLTGLGAWLVNGGGPGVPITPTSQSATAQAYNGCHDHIQPVVINYDVLYVQAKGSIVRDLSYNLWVNIYTGSDVSLLSDHLFENHQLLEWAWAEEPYKLLWAVRDDGTMLSLTYLKEQEVLGWARHDTQGLFKSVATVTESVPTIFGNTFADIVYVVVQRFVNNQWLYFVERMDPRIWETLEESWCLDAALSLPQNQPNAVLTAQQSEQPGRLGTPNVIARGSGYTNPSFIITDAVGGGTGGAISATLVAGQIGVVTVISTGNGYVAPQVQINDPTGSGAAIALGVDNTIFFSANSPVSWNVGDVIRMGGGVATITQVSSTTLVFANLTSPILLTVPNDPNATPLLAFPGNWTVTTPVSVVGGLNHLVGQTVKALADGSVVEGVTVGTDGTIVLPNPASSIVVGLPFQGQLQSLYTDIPGEATVQGKRKNIYAVTVRVRDSRGLKVGSNQIDASTQPLEIAEEWTNLVAFKERGNTTSLGVAIPLITGDERINIPGTWRKPGQIAVQQDNPLPANVLAFIPEIVIGDTNG